MEHLSLSVKLQETKPMHQSVEFSRNVSYISPPIACRVLTCLAESSTAASDLERQHRRPSGRPTAMSKPRTTRWVKRCTKWSMPLAPCTCVKSRVEERRGEERRGEERRGEERREGDEMVRKGREQN